MKTHQDIKRSLTDYSILLINKFVVVGLLLLSAPFLTRMLGRSGYGQFNLFILVVNIAFFGFISWTSASIVRFGKEEYIKEDKLNEVFWARNIIIFLGILISIFFFIFFREKIDEYLQVKFAYVFIIIFLLVQIILDYNCYIFQATGRLKISSLTELMPKVFFVILLLSLFFLDIKKITYILGALIISQMLSAALSFKWINSNWLFPVRTNKRIFGEILSFSYPLIFSALAAYIINYVDLIVIKKYFSISDVGVYSLSYNLMTYFQQIIMIVIIVTTPILIGLYTEKREDIIKTYLKILVPQGILFWSIFLTISIIFLPFFIPIIFGKEFSLSTIPAQILLVGLVISGINCFYSGVLTTYKLIKQAVVINIFMVVLNLTGDIFLVPILGIEGAAISSALAFSIGGLGYMYLGNKRLDLNEVKSIIFLVPVVGMFIGISFKINIFLLLIISILIYYFILSRFKLFHSSDTKLLDQINMPPKIRKIIYKAYSILEIG